MKFHIPLLILLQLAFALPAFAQDDADTGSTPPLAAPETTAPEAGADTGSASPKGGTATG
jgi:hypothetical protein